MADPTTTPSQARGAHVQRLVQARAVAVWSQRDPTNSWGIDRCRAAATYAGPDSGAASMPGTCTDRAGDVSPALGFGLKYNTTKPVVREGAAGARRIRMAGTTAQGRRRLLGVGSDCRRRELRERDVRGARQRRGLAGTGSCRDQSRQRQRYGVGYGLKYNASAPQVTASDFFRATERQWLVRPVP